MDYNSINSFLEKFRKIIFAGEKANGVISEIITKHLSFSIGVEKIKTKGSHIYIQGSPMLHNEIMIHKQGILADLKQTLPERNFTDIR